MLKDIFSSKTQIPISYKSNDCILCQLFRKGIMNIDDVLACRTDARRIFYSKKHKDHSTSLTTKNINNEEFISLIKDDSVDIIF